MVSLVEHRDFFFGGGAKRDKLDAFMGALLAQGLEKSGYFGLGNIAFTDIHDSDQGLARKEIEVLGDALFVFVQLDGGDGLEVVEGRF